jgi:uncharacterized protein YbjT (DUF2867 family)
MKVLLTGATGFTGSHVLPLLLDAGWSVRCFVRDPGQLPMAMRGRIEVVRGDLDDAESFRGACVGCDALVNVASIGFGHGPGIVDAAVAAGIQRALFVSTTAIFTQLNAPSKVRRIEAESAIMRSGLDWTILRPTMIYGTARDRNICRLIRYVSRFPVLPVFGSGTYLQQPVHVADLAMAIVAALESKAAAGRAYNISGKAPLTYNDLVRTVARLLERRMVIVHLPYRPVVAALAPLEKLGVRLPVKGEQILRLNEHKAFPHDDAGRDFGFAPRPFAAGVADEIASMGLLPVSVGRPS